MEDEVVLSFQDSVIRKSDVNLLQECGWLNDHLIGFWFEYLYHEVYNCDSSIILVSPEVTQFLKLASEEDVELFAEPMELSKKQLILFAINDSTSTDCPGGTHWSLLVYDAPLKTFYHVDSLKGSNHSHAVKVSRKLPFPNSNFVELPSSQQENTWDCGVYVCCNAEHILKQKCPINSNSILENPFFDMSLLKNSDMQNHRERMTALIYTISNRSK